MTDRTAQQDVDDFLDLNQITPEAADPGAWQGASLRGLMRPSAAAGRTLLMAGAPAAMALDKGADAMDTVGWAFDRLDPRKPWTPPPEAGTEAQDAYFGMVDRVGNSAVDFWTPNATETGTAAKVVNGLSEIVGSVPQIVGTPGLFLANAAFDPAIDLVNQGVDANTAMKVGAINLGVNALGLKIPAAFGTSLTTRVSTGAGVNLTAGIGADAASGAVLNAAGESEMAAGYDPLDPTKRFLDTTLGVVFGINANASARGNRAAVLALRNADHFQNRAAPGIPVDGKSALQHQNALTLAIKQLTDGDSSVDVAAAMPDADFTPRAAPVAAAVSAPAAGDWTAYRHALESGGKANARATTSAAVGIDQFIPSTWINTVAQADPAALPVGMTAKQANATISKGGRSSNPEVQALLDRRVDATYSGRMQKTLEANSRGALASSGQPVTVHNLYASHHFGDSKGVAFAKAPDDTPMTAILTAGQLKANKYLANLTKGEAIANWDKRAAKAGVKTPALRTPIADPDMVTRDSFLATARQFDVADEVALQLAPKALRDSVTGFYEGRVDSVKVDTLSRALAHVERTGEPAQYVSADIFNLGGLNKAMGDRAEVANVHYRVMAEALADELRATGADVIPLRTGGDEFGAVVVNADAAKVSAAFAKAEERIAVYAREQGLADIENPKRSTERGVGLHTGQAAITPGQSVTDILNRADAGVNVSKLKGQKNVTRETPGTPRPVAPGGQAGRTAGGVGAADRGVRREVSADDIAALGAEIGWSERGGNIIREYSDGSGLKPEVIGRTKWVGKIAPNGEESSFWRDRPDKNLTEKQAAAALEKFAKGEPLKPVEQRFIDHARKYAEAYAAEALDEATAIDEIMTGQMIDEKRAYKEEIANLIETAHQSAETMARESPDIAVILGFDADGQPRYGTLADAMADIETERARLAADAEAYPAAVNCFMRRGFDA